MGLFVFRTHPSNARTRSLLQWIPGTTSGRLATLLRAPEKKRSVNRSRSGSLHFSTFRVHKQSPRERGSNKLLFYFWCFTGLKKNNAMLFCSPLIPQNKTYGRLFLYLWFPRKKKEKQKTGGKGQSQAVCQLFPWAWALWEKNTTCSGKHGSGLFLFLSLAPQEEKSQPEKNNKKAKKQPRKIKHTHRHTHKIKRKRL